jgi:uncharacterized protein (DUF111 family)
MIGTLPDASGTGMIVVEANIDDMNPEIYPFVIERLLGAGAVDAWTVPVIMKKGRHGTILAALAPGVKIDAMTEIFLTQTTTIGVRVSEVSRRALPREIRSVKSSLGRVKVKVVMTAGEERFVPEFEECRRIALEKKIPLLEVYRTIEADLRAP